MRSDTTQLSLTRDDPRVGDPEMAAKFRELADWAMTTGDTAHFTAVERRDYYLAEARKYDGEGNGDAKR